MAPTLVQSVSNAGARVVSLDRPVTVIGSKPDCDVHLDSPRVSGAHAILVMLRERTYLRDLVSRTGVFVQDRRVDEALLRHGDRIRIGEFSFDFRISAGQTDGAARGASGNHEENARPAEEAEPLELVVEGYDAPPVPVEGPIFLIGRREGTELTLEDKLVSSAHAAIIESEGRWHLYDLKSKYGVWVNDTRTGSVALSDGDVIRIGGFRLRCQTAERAPVALSPHAPMAVAPAPAPPQTAASPKAPTAPAGVAAPSSERLPKNAGAPTAPSSPPPGLPPIGRKGSARKPEGFAVTVAPKMGEQEQSRGITVPEAPTHIAEGPRRETEEPEPEFQAASARPEPPEPLSAVAPTTPYLRIQQCKRCGFYLKPTALYCPACGKWRRRAYAVLAGSLLLLALLGALAAVWRAQSRPTPAHAEIRIPPAHLSPQHK